jgi:aminoglycoside phosphotransferase (APT) family kinase protein
MTDAAALLARLRRQGITGSGATASLFAGGYKNRVFRIRDGKTDLVAKLYLASAVDDNPYYPNHPELEALALQHLAGSGLVPDLVAWTAEDAEPALLVYRFVDGKVWSHGEDIAAHLIAAVHAVPPPEGMRRVPDSPAAICDHGARMLLMSGGNEALERLRPADSSGAPPAASVLLHTDCGPGNIIVAPDGAKLIDWQCPALGDAAEDIACFLSAAMMRLYRRPPHDAAGRERLLRAYGAGDAVERYRRHGAAYHWRIACYCAYRAETLARSDPATASAYREALAAEIALLGTLAS